MTFYQVVRSVNICMKFLILSCIYITLPDLFINTILTLFKGLGHSCRTLQRHFICPSTGGEHRRDLLH